ncbi:MAG: hypothetical protein LQ350_004676 [Teloschistes chrysophthalmus]|nr:MAG: hypothetical protein LQ350_004676 [Niorma chrysophthalma]
MPPPPRSLPYRDLLTPVLHRRFTQAAGICLLLCYLEAIIIGDKSSLSLFQTLKQYLWCRDVLETPFAYVLSAFLFSEVYIWSVPKEAELGWMTQGRSWERARLNERPIYLRSLYIGLALLQTTFHLYFDYDRIEESVPNPMSDPSIQRASNDFIHPRERIKSKMPDLLRELSLISAGLSTVGPILYSLTLRRIAWRTSLACARFFRWDIPQTQELSYIPPYHYGLILRSLFSGLLLLLIWRISNVAFSAYVAQEPLKRGQPLTQESNDPNGSLINGLKANKSVVKVSMSKSLKNLANDVGKSFAYWELAMISQRFPERRVFIFKDIDRQGGAAWSQISAECLRMIDGVTARISAYGQQSTQQQALVRVEDLQFLPRLGMPLKQEPVVMSTPQPSTRREMIEAKVGTFAKSVGNNPVASYGSPLGPKGTQYIEAAREKLLTPEQRQALTPANIRSQFYVYLTRFLRSRLGQPFRQTFARRIRSIAFGQPFSELIPTIHAVYSLTSLVTASLKEDAYGKVAKDIPLVMRTFIVTYQTLDRFAGTLSPHWTDVEFSDSQRQTEDVMAMLGALKHCLGDTVKAFSGLSADLGIRDQDMRMAKAIAGIK